MIKYIKTIFCLFVFATQINVQAQVPDTKVAALVEALWLAAPDGNLYSDWQVKPSNIPSWSKPCLGKKITPTELANEPDTARLILGCKIGAILQKEDVNNISIIMRRAAAWWMTGNSNDYNKASMKNYTLKVLEFYNNLK